MKILSATGIIDSINIVFKPVFVKGENFEKSKGIVLTIFIVCLFISSASAKEIDKGRIEIGGNFDVSISSTDSEVEGLSKTSTDTHGIDAEVLYYVIPNLGFGLLMGYENSEASSGGLTSETTTTLFGPTLKYNISLNENVSTNISGILVKSSLENKSSGTTVKADGFGWGLACGMSYFFTDSVSLNGGAYYQSLALELDSANTDFDISGLTFNIGISVYIK